MKLLEGKSIIITGASSGIGRSAAIQFADHGANLVLISRGRDALNEVAETINGKGGTALAYAGDIRDAASHEGAVDLAMNRFGQLDGAFNNAGTVGSPALFADLEIAEWENVLTTNLTSAFLAARAQIPALLEGSGGSLVFTSSFVGTSVGLMGMGAYASAKSGLGGLVKSITADYAHRGIRANTLLPDGTDTAMAGDEGNREWAASLHPVGRIAHPDEIASAALFLLSDMASFVIGSQLWADGGNSATKLPSV